MMINRVGELPLSQEGQEHRWRAGGVAFGARLAGMAKRNMSENWKQGLVGMGPKGRG